MDIETFVKESLIQIANGVKKANGEVTSKPFSLKDWITDQKRGGVDFDIAVTVSSEKGGGAGAKLNIAVVRVGAGGEISTTHESVSRIKFTITIHSEIC